MNNHPVPRSVSTPRRRSPAGEAWWPSTRTWRTSRRASHATTATPDRRGNDFQLGDVMGGVVIRLFMEQSL